MKGALQDKRVLVVDESPELAELVAAALVRAGATATLCSTGDEALTELAAEGPHGAVVDVPLPDVRAVEVLGALRRAGIPAVAVSGVFKGQHAAEEARRLGACAFFEKPFPVGEVVVALERALGVDDEPLAQDAVEDEVTGAVPLDEPLESRGGPPHPDPLPGGEGNGARGVPPSRPVRSAARPPPEGSLARTSVPRLLSALHTAQATGALTVSRDKVKKLVLVERGVPVYAASNLGSERFGALCVAKGILSRAELAALRIAPGERTSDVLLARRMITPERRIELVAEQVRAILWSTFEWRDGSYRFEMKGLPSRERLDLGLDAGELLLEGIRRTSTLVRLREELPSAVALAPAPDPAFELYALRLSAAEAHLLSVADGTKSIADLVALAEMPEREALAFLHACRVLGVLDEVRRVLASTRHMSFM